jgi:hypothetical protein
VGGAERAPTGHRQPQTAIEAVSLRVRVKVSGFRVGGASMVLYLE